MSGLSHVVFLILTIIFPPFALLWIICAASAGKSKRKQDLRMREEELQLLRKIANRGDK